MHVEMKFATNLALPEDKNTIKEEDQAEQLSQRSPSPGNESPAKIRENQFSIGDVDADNLSVRDKKALTKCLVKQDCEFREKMYEIVKDFPSMRTEVGGGNFEKIIGERLLQIMKESKAEISDGTSKEEIVGQFTKYVKAKIGPPD